MIAATESQLFELDRIPEAFAAILTAQGVNASYNRGRNVDKTPRVEIAMTAGTNEGRRFLRNRGNGWSGAQPYNTWAARFEVDVTTNRTTNWEEHRKLVGIVRYNFQLYRLIETWTEAVAPFHSISSMIEEDEQMEISSEDNTDTTRLVFTGLVNIRDDSWPIPTPPTLGVVEYFDLMDGESFFTMDQENFELAS